MAPAFVDIPIATVESFGWTENEAVREIVTALTAAEKDSVRFVGGCVRDSLLGFKAKDIDIATTLEPEAVTAALAAAGLRSAPTGLAHGTITAIAESGTIEVTTLRSDVSTDGRRATVAYTKDWATDARRRDFTVNAIYLTPERKLYDPVGGIIDAKNRRIRFIGDSRQRIREDYLRILRFFRFSARFALEIDSVGLAASKDMRDGIDHLSAERVGSEFLSILALTNAEKALRWMEAAGVLEKIWPHPANVDAVAALKRDTHRVHPCVVLAALYGDAGNGIGARLRLSNAEKSIRTNALKGAREIAPGLSNLEVRQRIYFLGRTIFRDGLNVAAATSEVDVATKDRYATILADWNTPEFPLSGRDIVEHGVKPGPPVAAILKKIERQWAAEDFPQNPRLAEILTAAINSESR
ncbi:MAG: CCA tRNA nucleotidyltransferase [Marinicaulis sp.]|nr:CCA tRNA nucleotidyltransferase [Marinicaulis sp.]